MKKRLVTILSLIMAFVLCFSLVACGGDNGGNKGNGPNKKDPPQADNTVSISVNDALDAVNGVLNAKGFTGTASYTLSTKNTEALTDSLSLDKRGSKLKIASGDEEIIVDLKTGYVYYKHGDYYSYSNEFYANAFDYVQYLLVSLKQEDDAKKINAIYDEKSKTYTFTVEKADSVNKYLEPLQNAYKKDKTVGDSLNDYCKLLFGKDFDAMYTVFENYVKKPENTVGTLLGVLKEAGLDVEAILEMFEIELDAELMAAVKARPLNKLIAGAYNFLMENLGNLLPLAEDETDEDLSDSEDGGMEALGMGLVNAMLFEEISDADITTALTGMKGLVAIVKNAAIKTTIDAALKDNAKAADLYTVIKDGVKLKNATMTLIFTVDDAKNITGVKLDYIVSHTYTGEAAEGSILADNDYRATAEIVIDEYKTSTEDFVITGDPAMEYKTPIVMLVYNVTDKDVSVYYETSGKTVTVNSYILEWVTPSGEIREIQPEDENAFKFDAATSSFVFDKELVNLTLSDEALSVYLQQGYSAFGTSLQAIVFFDDDEYNGYAITLTYVNDDWQAIYDYAYETVMGLIMGGGSDAPNISENVVA